jgi:hypothetical protein
MRRLAGCGYGYRAVAVASLLHLPLLRVFARADLDDSAVPARPPFCSQACALSDRLGGVDPVPHLADHMTLPADLARSPFYRYLFTLTR